MQQQKLSLSYNDVERGILGLSVEEQLKLAEIIFNGLTDDLYIKMNSRGKPLTAFENFKAHFEDMLTTAHPKEKIKYFADKVDTAWSDTLWPYRGEDNLIDDKFMRYFRFVTEVCAWLGGVSFDNETRTDDLAERVYGNTNCSEHLEFLFEAFDIWHQKNIKAEFESIFTATPSVETDPLILFNAFHNPPDGERSVDLFAACCRLYGKPQWTFAHTLLLYAMLLSRIHNTDNNFPRQVRILRNLIEASGEGWIRRDNMHKLLPDVKRVVVLPLPLIVLRPLCSPICPVLGQDLREPPRVPFRQDAQLVRHPPRNPVDPVVRPAPAHSEHDADPHARFGLTNPNRSHRRICQSGGNGMGGEMAMDSCCPPRGRTFVCSCLRVPCGKPRGLYHKIRQNQAYSNEK